MGGLKVERFKEEVEGVVWKKSEELKVEQLLQNVLKTLHTLWSLRLKSLYLLLLQQFFSYNKSWAGSILFYFIFSRDLYLSMTFKKAVYLYFSLISLVFVFVFVWAMMLRFYCWTLLRDREWEANKNFNSKSAPLDNAYSFLAFFFYETKKYI